MKRAFIFDLDNTVFPVPSIGHQLFKPLFDLLTSAGIEKGKMDGIKYDVMRKPFQWVAKHYGLSQELTDRSIEILKTLKHSGEIVPYPDFNVIREYPGDKFIVTTGFTNMQASKVKALGLDTDFKGIFIIDPTRTSESKKDVFEKIMQCHGYSAGETIIIGDDPDSEIKAANELGVDSVLYDKLNVFPDAKATHKISDYQQLRHLLESKH